MHAPTFNKWHKKKKKKKNKNKNKKMTIHILTHGTMRECGLTFLVVCINDRIHDIRERNTSRKHGKKEPRSFSHCGSFDHCFQWVPT
jgi:hypothetical protein